jgi:thiosulfate/3-mercaptopyruvate sulfurtransferase
MKPTLVTVLLAAGAFLIGCNEKEAVTDDSTISDGAAAASCEGCHTDYALLKSIASPDTASAGGGCGGDIPHIEPYDRVYMGGAGFAAFKASTHGRHGCVSCHGGNGATADKAVAHGGDFIRHPSDLHEVKCSPCHAAINGLFHNSIHKEGWGQKSMVALRSGVTNFSQLSPEMQAGYKVNCAKCHGGCGSCHVNRPVAGGGGLLNGHKFNRRPDMTDNCVACHTSRGGHAYFGIGSGTVPDVHLAAVGHCVNCHGKTELHGNGQVYDQRYKVPMMPKCTDCHGGLASSNIYHTTHINTFNCGVCHSQDYNNCGSCHIGGAGARIPSYMGFKIGMNPLPDIKRSTFNNQPYKFATLRRSLMAPDSWQNYGVANLPSFDARPTFKYTTAHNTLRWTKRTQVGAGKACYDNCHIIQEGTTFRNKDLYLFNSDLQSWELTADQGIVVDGRLPAGWNVH